MPGRRMPVYTSAAILVRAADEGARVALVLLAVQRLASPAAGGVLVAALLLPHVVAAPVLGAAVDRVRRPMLLVTAGSVGLGLALALTAAGVGRVPLPLVVAILIAGGSCGPALTGALSSQLPALVARPALPRAFGVDALTYDVAGMLGPAVVAVVAARASAAAATVTLAGAAVAGGALVATLPARREASAPGPSRKTSAGAGWTLLAGLRALVRSPVLAVVTSSTSLAQLGFGALPVVVAVMATRAGSPSEAGLLLTVLTAGSLVGSLLWTWRPARPERAPWIVLLGVVATGLPLLAAAWSFSLAWTAALFALSGAANGPLFGALLLTREHFAPEHVRSQVFTLGAGLKITTAAAGAALAGLVAGLPSSGQLLLVGACPVLAGVAGSAWLLRSPQPSVSARGAEGPGATVCDGLTCETAEAGRP
jgi:MFS family permease